MASGIDHFSLAVNSLGSAIDFFEQAFNMRLIFCEYGMTDQIQSMLGLNNDVSCNIAQLSIEHTKFCLELIEFKVPYTVSPLESLPIFPSMGHAGFWVENFDEHMSRLKVLGAAPLGKVTKFTTGRSVYIKTGFGAVIEVSEKLKR